MSPLSGNSTNKGSAWNTAGTWEEKHLNVKDLEEALKNTQIMQDGYRVEDISIDGGHISVVSVRGKQSLGYNLKTEFKVKAPTGVTYTVKCDEVNEYGDPEVDCKSNQSTLLSLKTNKSKLSSRNYLSSCLTKLRPSQRLNKFAKGHTSLASVCS